jgi:hypothetical protein
VATASDRDCHPSHGYYALKLYNNNVSITMIIISGETPGALNNTPVPSPERVVYVICMSLSEHFPLSEVFSVPWGD